MPKKDKGSDKEKAKYDSFVKDSGSILDDTIKDLEFGPAPPIQEILNERSSVPATSMFMKGDILMTSVKLYHSVTPETLDERAQAISKFIREKGSKEGKMQILKYGEGTLLLETHESIIYATSWYGKVTKKEMKESHKAVKKIHDNISQCLLESTPLPKNFNNLVCRAYDIRPTPPQEEVLEDAHFEEVPTEPTVEDTVSDIMEKVKVETKKTPAGTTEAKIFQALSSLPRGIPSELWGRPMEELVDQIMVAKHALSNKGEYIMDLDGEWYYAEPKKMSRFLTIYKGEIVKLSEVDEPGSDEMEGTGIRAEVSFEIKRAKKKGFNVSKLERALTLKKDEDIEKVLDDFKRIKAEADGLIKRLGNIVMGGLEKEAKEVKERILTLKYLKKAKEEIFFLEKKLKKRKVKDKARLEMLRKEVEAIQSKGYSVPHLFRLLQTGNTKLILEAIDRFKLDEDKLKKLEERAHHLKNQGFDIEIEEIKHHFNDPGKIPFLEEELDKLKEELRLEEERQKVFEQLRERMKAWEKQGFNTTKLKKILSRDLDIIESAFKEFDNQVKRMIKFEAILETFRGQGIDMDVNELKSKIMDVDNIISVGNGINLLRAKIERKKRTEERKKVLQEGLARWRKEGWTVSRLGPLFDGDIEDLEAGFKEFQENIDITKDILEFMDNMDTVSFETEVERIKQQAKDPSNFEKVNEAIDELEAAVKKRREALRPQMPKKVSRGELIRLIESLPDGLPESLWGRSARKLGVDILSGTFGNTPDKKVVVRITRRWYHYEPDEPGLMLKPYTGEVRKIDVDSIEKEEVAIPSALAGAGGQFTPSTRVKDVEEGPPKGRARSSPSWAADADDKQQRPSGSVKDLRRKISSRMDRRVLSEGAISQFRGIDFPYDLTEIDILEKISTLPRGLPSSLWMDNMEELAKKIMDAEYAETPKGLVLVCIDGEWYYGNPSQPGRYLQAFRG